MRKLSVFVFLVYLLLVPVGWSQAQEPVVAVWETDTPPEGGWTAGDPIPLRLRATYTADFEVMLPELPEQWEPFEVQEQALSEPTVNDDGTVTVIREATVTLWSPGEYETPPLKVRCKNAAGEIHETPVPPLSVTVASVLTEDDLEKRDLKPQASLPRPPVWPWVLAGLLGAVLLFLAARWLLRRLRRRKAVGPESLEAVDTRPPEVVAYEELDRIAALDLPAQGKFKHHYTLVTDCVRVYLEGICRVPAMDRTTGELLTALRHARVNGEPVALLRTLLEEADLVKFAKSRPTIERARDAVGQTRRFVDVTKPDHTATGESPEPTTQHVTHNT